LTSTSLANQFEKQLVAGERVIVGPPHDQVEKVLPDVAKV